MKKKNEEEKEINESFPNLSQEPIAGYEVEKKKMTFDEAVAACNGTTVKEFMDLLRERVEKWYDEQEKSNH